MRAGRKRKIGDREPTGRPQRGRFKPRAEYLAAVLGYETRALYIIQIGTTAVKIGISGDPSARLRYLQCGQEKSLRMVWSAWLRDLDAVYAENVIHRKLIATSNHARGECYFMATDTAIAFVESILGDLELRYLTDDEARRMAVA